jgi:4-amino-4-deoxy-L-arabinose transferase-like glycosyltransferase
MQMQQSFLSAEPGSTRDLRLLLFFLFVVAITNGFHVEGLPLYKEEPRRVLIAQEMLISGDFISPTLFQKPYWKKPPLHNWRIAACAGGDGLLTILEARLPTLAAFVLLGAGVFVLIRILAPGGNAIFGVLVSMMNGIMLVEFARTAQPDMLLTMFCLFSYGLFMLRPQGTLYLVLSSFFMGCSILTKGYGPLFFYPGLLLYCLLYEERKGWWLRRLCLHAVLSLLLPLIWLGLYASENDLAKLFSVLGSEVAIRAEGDGGNFFLHLIAFPAKMLLALLPWPLVLLVIRRRLQFVRTPLFLSSLCIAATSFGVFMCLQNSLERYLLPAIPFLGIMFAHWIPRDAELPKGYQRSIVFVVVTAALAAVGFFAGRGYIEALPWLAIPLVFSIGYVFYRGRNINVHGVFSALALLLLWEHGYYLAKGLESPQPGPVIEQAAEVMEPLELPWVLEDSFFPVELGTDYTRTTGTLGHYSHIAEERGLSAGEHILWSTTDEHPGCEVLEALRFRKGPSPIYLMQCEGRQK